MASKSKLLPQRLIKVLDLLFVASNTLNDALLKEGSDNQILLRKFKRLAAIFARQANQLSGRDCAKVPLDNSIAKLSNGLSSLSIIASHLSTRSSDRRAMLALFVILIQPPAPFSVEDQSVSPFMATLVERQQNQDIFSVQLLSLLTGNPNFDKDKRDSLVGVELQNAIITKIEQYNQELFGGKKVKEEATTNALQDIQILINIRQCGWFSAKRVIQTLYEILRP